jgi:hypothetical protein
MDMICGLGVAFFCHFMALSVCVQAFCRSIGWAARSQLEEVMI